MRILFSSTGAMGHFRSLLPFIRACVEGGQQTLLAGPPGLASMAKEHGFEFVAFDAPSKDDLRQLRSSFRSLPEDEQNTSLRRETYGRLRPSASLPGLTEICSRWKPEAVVRDAAEFGSALAAEQHQIPVIRVSWLATFEDQIIRLCAKPLDELRRSLGLPPDPDAVRIRDSPRLTFWPASLEAQSGDSPPLTVRFRDPRWDAPTHQLTYEWGGLGGPLIYVTFGTIIATLDMASHVYAEVVTALRSLPVRAVLATGHPGGERIPIANPPAHVRVEPWVNQVDVLADAALVLCHGGATPILDAAACGVPMVIAPVFGDQHANASLVGDFGAGAVAELSADSIRGALVQVLGDDVCRRRAQALARELRTHAQCARIIDLLAELGAGATGALLG